MLRRRVRAQLRTELSGKRKANRAAPNGVALVCRASRFALSGEPIALSIAEIFTAHKHPPCKRRFWKSYFCPKPSFLQRVTLLSLLRLAFYCKTCYNGFTGRRDAAGKAASCRSPQRRPAINRIGNDGFGSWGGRIRSHLAVLCHCSQKPRRHKHFCRRSVEWE